MQIQQAQNPLCTFLARLRAPYFTGVGGSLTSNLYRRRLSWQFIAVSTVSQCQVAWSPDCIKGVRERERERERDRERDREREREHFIFD